MQRAPFGTPNGNLNPNFAMRNIEQRKARLKMNLI